MILDRLERLPDYFPLHPGFVAAHGPLTEMLHHPPSPGRYEIVGDRLFIIVARDAGRGQAASPLEFHRRYIDIQLALADHDVMGWQATSRCQQTTHAYDPARDIGFFGDAPAAWFRVNQGDFAIFTPQDAHAPLAATGPVFKAVVKVAVDWPT